MKKQIITFIVATTFISAAILSACNSATQKEEAAHDRVDDAKEELSDARKAATAEEWKAFKDESELKIKDNEIRIAELKTKIKKSGNELDAVYEQKINNLEQKNKALQAKIDAYGNDLSSDWESFKREFNHDMDEFGSAFKDLTVNNKK
jgi:exonuclease VII large subunit